MSFPKMIMKSILEALKKRIDEADAIVIGAGAGLSTASGFVYGGDYFLKEFPEMNRKYGYTDMYGASFHDFATPEERWGFWSKMIYLNRYQGAKPLYLDLLKVVSGKDYFVITTNVDHQFQLAGFDKKRLFYTQGDYGLFQCSKACHQKTYDNEAIIKEMLKQRKDGLVPAFLVPHCPVCGEEMEVNLRKDDLFVQDKGWEEASLRYSKFIDEHKAKRVLFLELGVGFNTPVIIKYPFMRMTYQNPNAFYVCVNLGYNYVPPELENRSLLIDGDLREIITTLAKAK